jgi:hypothetical protein
VALAAAAAVGLAAAGELVGVGEDAGAEQAKVSMVNARPPPMLNKREGRNQWDMSSPEDVASRKGHLPAR